MKLSAHIAQTPTPINPPAVANSGLEQATAISLLVAAISATAAALGAIGNKLWGWFESKEKAESTLTSTVINTMLDERKQLIDVNRDGFNATTKALAEIQKASEQLSQTIHSDIQKGMGGQTAIYRTIAESLGEIKAQNRALHERVDGIFETLRNLKNHVNHEN